MRKAKVKVLDIQLQKWENKLSSSHQKQHYKLNQLAQTFINQQSKIINVQTNIKITFSFIDCQKTLVISSPVSSQQQISTA
jgi:hypothetical protein